MTRIYLLFIGLFACILCPSQQQFLPAGFILPFPFGCDLNQLNEGVEQLTKVLPSLFIDPSQLSFESMCSTVEPLLEGIEGCLRSLQGLSDLLQTNVDIKAAVDFVISMQVFCGNGPEESQGLLCDFSSLVSCTLRSVDAVKAAAMENIETICTTVREANTGLVQCVEDATSQCPAAVQVQLKTAVQSQVDFLGRITQYCFPGCEPIVKFLLDGYPRWSEELDFTIKESESYCSPLQRTLDVVWGLVSNCTLVTSDIENFIVRDILSFANLTGCNLLLDGEPLVMSGNTILACIQASNVCARRVAALVGVTTDLGPSGGYNINQVVNTTNAFVNRVISGEASQICSVVKDDLWAQTMGCIQLVTDKCEAELEEQTEIIIMKNTTEILSQVCSPGCIDIQRRIQEIEQCQSNVQVSLDQLPVNILTGFISPGGADIEPCLWIRGYVKCLFDAIKNCPFLNEQYQNLVAPAEKVNMVISVCRITFDLQTGDFYIGNQSQPLLQIFSGSGNSYRTRVDLWILTMLAVLILSIK